MQTPKRKPNPYSLIPPDYHMTERAIDELKKELDRLIKKVRPKVIEEMQSAAELGDFSENHAYQMAKHRLRGINATIEKLERQITRAIPISANLSSEKIEIGHRVTVKVNGKEKIYKILGAQEADPGSGIISHLSPLGSILIGKKVGDIVELKTEDNSVAYEIIKID